jgi:transglutaminase-like putative cysteine protease
MRLTIRHETIYRYTSPVRYSIQYLRLTPRTEADQRVRFWQIDAPGRMWHQTDAFGNTVHVMSLEQPHHELAILVTGEVETGLRPGTPIELSTALPPAAFLVPTPLTEADDAIRTLAQSTLSADARNGSSQASVDRLMAAILERVTYETGSTDVYDTAAHALAKKAGVCQDHTHIFLACCRAQGIPARYVSGYLFTGDEGHLASHAWADVWIAARGWLSFDTTHACFADERYCRLAIGRDFLDASPVRGMRRGGTGEALSVSVRVGQTYARAEQQ